MKRRSVETTSTKSQTNFDERTQSIRSSALLPTARLNSVDTSIDVSSKSKLVHVAYNCLTSPHFKPSSMPRNDPTPLADIFNNDMDEPYISDEASHSKQSLLRNIHHVKLIWLDANIDKLTRKYRCSLNQFYGTVGQIKTFTRHTDCIDFVRSDIDQTLFLIVSNDFAHLVIPTIHEVSKLNSIYILCTDTSEDIKWIKGYYKVKGTFADIDSIYDLLKFTIQSTRRGSIDSSESSFDLNHLDASFMYTRMFKEILLTVPFSDESRKDFFAFCREECNSKQFGIPLGIINELENDYDKHSSIWWYTRDCFMSRLLNQAVRSQNFHVLIKIGFFIQDLHRKIEQLHKSLADVLICYRGQGLLHDTFEQLREMEGGLLFFNTFLSTTRNESVATIYAESSHEDSNLTGVVFKIIVDPAVPTSTRLADLGDEGYYLDDEEETLFSMHSVFRIGKITKLNNHLHQVELFLTSDNDKDLQMLSDCIHREMQGDTEWVRLSKLLLNITHFDKNEELLEILFQNSSDTDLDKHGYRCHLQGVIKKNKNLFEDALSHFKEALQIYQNSSKCYHIHIATICNEIGSIYHYKQEYSTAIQYYQMALNIQIDLFPRNHSNLQLTYTYLANAYRNLNQCSIALGFYERVLNIYKKSQLVSYAYLADIYEDIGEMLYQMERYEIAFKRFRKVSIIRQHRVAHDDAKIAISLVNVSRALEMIFRYLEALQQCQYAYNILKSSDSVDYIELAKICQRIAYLYEMIKDDSNALIFYQESLKYLEHSPMRDRASLARTHRSIGRIFERRGETNASFNSYTLACEFERR
ncbi:unnamed protein product [Adineta ricciae]|uniref:Uncharacterized protein n=1 Tax=Adineta ricciae TaxID=249248 RepID=A0A814IQ41_ADIRI|nr:unnamed protein product [Adineta ricciae]CAF1026638.1 unnamed protein product [Adineta ricciae]